MMLIEPETGNIIDVNLAATEFYGWPTEIFTTMKIQDINQLGPEEVFREMKKAKDEDKHVFYFRHSRADGSIRLI